MPDVSLKQISNLLDQKLDEKLKASEERITKKLRGEINGAKDELRGEIKASEERIIQGVGDFVHNTILPQFDDMATKEEVNRLTDELRSKANKDDIRRLENKIDHLDTKTDQIIKQVDITDKRTSNHEDRLNRIESTPTVAHELKKK